ncbi:MAG: hypothetical protein FJ276_35255, partial [Planctomycetes bacterium]|nr:hypothetical protein [Planctomycetota bacterium]
MRFLYSILAFGFFLAAVPVLIHLINLMRHRRVQWAAMEFLLQSYRKHRKWVMLRQLLLLLARVTAVILLVALLAQLEIQWPHQGMFSGTLTHHYVLVDDSMSTSDRSGGITAFERGMGFVYQLGSEAARQESRQRFTLIRFSTAALARVQPDAQVAAGDEKTAELSAELVDPQFMLRLEEIRRTAEPTQLAVGPEAALRVAKRVMEQRSNERRVLHVVSDFRSREWDNPRELRALLSDVERLGTEIHFVWSARGQQPNLAITGLQPAPETRASGVPLFMTVQVTNYGAEPQEKIPLRMRTFAYDAAAIQSGGAARPIAAADDLPLMQIDRINPYETVTQRVQVYFAEAGKHVVQAMLPEDAVPADNLRWCVVDFPEAEAVLVIDGDPKQRNAFYMQAIFEPGQRARTGVRPAVRDPSYLRDVAADALREFSAIYLCDVERLDDQALANLESYVRGGGGLAVFVGPQVNTGYYSQQFARNAAGLFPVPLDHDDLLDDDPVSDTPDLEVLALDHPLFRELVQGQNPIIRMIRVERFLRVE